MQGQTFKAVGVDMTDRSFTHGILYAVLSKVGSLKLYVGQRGPQNMQCTV